MSGGMRVVWVLGAGFSKPLGGPVLDDLLSRRLQADLHDRLSGDSRFAVLRRTFDMVHKVYGTDLPLGELNSGASPSPWRNAEEFLEYVDLATNAEEYDREQQACRVLHRLLGRAPKKEINISDLAVAARRYLVAACSGFIEEVDYDSERWAPYSRWTKELGASDRVVTFNYDNVPETLAADPSAKRIHVVVPSVGATDSAAKEAEQVVAPSVLKLHGSVTWVVQNSPTHNCEEAAHRGLPEDVLRSESLPAIAAPGPSKLGMTRTLFRSLWDASLKAIREADVIVFVGYRFPETDNEAKRRLLGAIRDRDAARPLTVQIVLGPDTNYPDVRRLEGMLTWALSNHQIVDPEAIGRHNDDDQFPAGKAAIVAQPLWAQDFLAVFQRRGLHVWGDYNDQMRSLVKD